MRAATLSRPAAWLVAACLLLAGCQSTTPLRDEQAGSGLQPATTTSTAAATAAVAAGGDCCLRANLWDRMRAGFRFDLSIDNERIAAQRNWYLRNPAYLDRVVARGSRYLHYIVEEIEARDMPMELALLPVVESAFDPYAYSVAHAGGPWQFIPSTGRIYGLKQDWWYDGRRDLEQSTRAALDFLERLAQQFDGDYYKALAAYNAGPGNVNRAINRNLRAGKKTDYWSLPVPRETRAYVPKLVALAQIVNDPAKYGVRLNPIPDEPRIAMVEVGRQIDLARAAELADMPLAELFLYNPGHNRWATDPQGPKHLLVPVEVAPRFREALAATPPDDWLNHKRHTVAEGETLEAIAQLHGVGAETLRRVNHLAGDQVNPGETLLVPQPRLAIGSADNSYEPRIAQLNDGVQRRAAEGAPRTYKVRSGDTLSRIAAANKVRINDLARWNNMSVSKPLRIGQTLQIRGGSAASTPTVAATSRRKGVQHKVQPGDTLYGIARKFSVSVHDLARWNEFSPQQMLRAGQTLKVFPD